MKYIITFLWALIISQVTFYLGAQLTKMTYNPVHALLLAVFATIVVVVIASILPPITPIEEDSTQTY